ncbi:MAG: type VI secretion system baseplate subunit TssF [Planctomycetota bacterium]
MSSLQFDDWAEEELSYLREALRRFAQEWPEIAAKLEIHPQGTGEFSDPRIERLVVAIAILNARVRERLDSELPAVVDLFLDHFAPQLARPTPSFAVLQLQPILADGRASVVRHLPQGTDLETSPGGGERGAPETGRVFRYRTTCGIDVAPVEIHTLQVSTRGHGARLTIGLRTMGSFPFQQLGSFEPRFFISRAARWRGELFAALRGEVRGRVRELPHTSLTEVVLPGFAEATELLPLDERVDVGPRTLQEYSLLPDKFAFFELPGLGAALRECDRSEITLELDLDRALSRTESASADDLRLNCVPVVNLWKERGEAVRVDGRRSEVSLRTTGRSRVVFDVASVRLKRDARAAEELPSVRDLDHVLGGRPAWRALRCEGTREVERLALVNLGDWGLRDESALLLPELWVTDGEAAARWTSTRDPVFGDLHVVGMRSVFRGELVLRPTRSQAAGAIGRYQLLADTALRSTVLEVDAGPSPRDLARLRGALSVYARAVGPLTSRAIQGLVELETRTTRRRVGREVRAGLEVELTIDESGFAIDGVQLFGEVLTRFLVDSVPAGNFVELILVSHSDPLRRWSFGRRFAVRCS